MALWDYIRICPKCQSKEVTQRGMISGRVYNQDYVCQSCGFQGPLFPEVKRSAAKKLPDKPRDGVVPSQMPIFPIDRYVSPERARRFKMISIAILLLILLRVVFSF